MVNLRSALVVCCLLLTACAPASRTSRGTAVPPALPTSPAEESAGERTGTPIIPPSDELRSNSTQEDRYSCRRACDRDYSVCTDTAAARRDDFSRNRTYAASTCDRQLNMCFIRCNSIN
jgi:hypothetical protein